MKDSTAIAKGITHRHGMSSMRSWIFGSKGGNKEEESGTTGNPSAGDSTGIGPGHNNANNSSDGAETQTR